MLLTNIEQDIRYTHLIEMWKYIRGSLPSSRLSLSVEVTFRTIQSSLSPQEGLQAASSKIR